jgi:hypothetical protein
MKKLTLAALALAATTVAFADDITPDTYRDTQSLKTRQQVVAERDQAKRDGSIKVWSISYNQFANVKTTTTRSAVRAETKAAVASGEIDAFTGEDSGSFALARGNGRVHDSRSVVAGTTLRTAQ